jgi:hypothetical protein
MPLAKTSDRISASTQVRFPAPRRQRQMYLTLKPIDNWALEVSLRVWLRGFPTGESGHMCDYSMHNVRMRPAKVGDELTTRHFGTSTRGFADSEDASLAVCLLPGTELAFAADVACEPTSLLFWRKKSSIRPQSFGKSTKIRLQLIMMHSNFRMAKSAC